LTRKPSSILLQQGEIARLIGAVLFEQNDEWATQHRYMQVEAFSRINTGEVDPILSISMEAV
jgi:putative transposase